VKTGALKRVVLFQAGCACWIPGRVLCVAASWLVLLGVLLCSRAAVFLVAAAWCRQASLLLWPAGGVVSKQSCSRVVSAVATDEISGGAGCDVASRTNVHLLEAYS
jgi:hypothetical protein